MRKLVVLGSVLVVALVALVAGIAMKEPALPLVGPTDPICEQVVREREPDLVFTRSGQQKQGGAGKDVCAASTTSAGRVASRGNVTALPHSIRTGRIDRLSALRVRTPEQYGLRNTDSLVLMPFERAGSTGPRVRARSARMWGGEPVRSKTTAQDASGTAIVSSIDLWVARICGADEPSAGCRAISTRLS
jgi:hypothetical protein